MATSKRRARVPLFRMSSDQFCELPASDLFKLELFDGEVLMATRPIPTQQHFVFQLGIVLDQWVKIQKTGRILLGTQMKLDGGWTLVPDLCFIRLGHLKNVQKKRIVGPADLATEVLAPAEEGADRKVKFGVYARFEIPWLWVVDLDRRVLKEYELVGVTYTNKLAAAFDHPFRPRAFPGLVIDLASLEWQGIVA